MSKERIHPSTIVDNWLSGANDAELEALVEKHAATLSPLEAAEREHAEALRRCDDAAAALSAAERLFDAEPIEANDRAEKELRAAKDLAVSRAERARQRVEAARAAVAAAEKAVAVARLQKASGALRELETELSASIATTHASAATALPRAVASLARTLASLASAEEQTAATLAAMRSDLAALPDEQASIKRRLLALAPELAGELAADIDAAAAAREEQARAALARRASLAGFKEEIAGDVAAMLFAESMLKKHKARIEEALEEQRAAARAAQDLGEHAEPIEAVCLDAHIRHARYLTQPSSQRDVKGRVAMLRKVFGLGTVTERLSDEEVIELCANATSQSGLERTILHIQRERAFEAGDVNELRRRRVLAEMRAEEEEYRGMSLAQIERLRRVKSHLDEQKETARRKAEMPKPFPQVGIGLGVHPTAEHASAEER
ncbi:hypothetical protein [Sorangium sp. So ce1000]|uniref:hypothetical protein n=1 Tax=Sorangium sp. So ce1000 TaxID=3133325 RepID=UPI003F63D4EC